MYVLVLQQMAKINFQTLNELINMQLHSGFRLQLFAKENPIYVKTM